MSLYLWLNLGSISFPLLRSFESRIFFFRTWKAIFLSISSTACLFIPWDIFFVHHGIWGFNPHYLLGTQILSLPIEEWMFFVCIPYANLFIYACVRYFFPRGPLFSLTGTRCVCWVLIALLLVLGLFYYEKTYTSVVCLLLCGWLGLGNLWDT